MARSNIDIRRGRALYERYAAPGDPAWENLHEIVQDAWCPRLGADEGMRSDLVECLIWILYAFLFFAGVLLAS